MTRVRCVTEMGMGVDVHGRDATKAAKRAVSDAIRHSSLGFFRMIGKTANDMFVDVTIAVPNPEAVDKEAVAKELPYGTVTVTAVKGGLGDSLGDRSGQRSHPHRQCSCHRQLRQGLDRCPTAMRRCSIVRSGAR
ncbi:uncharacterized protein (TIGR02058 family) [Bradyrhizobium ottawaense]